MPLPDPKRPVSRAYEARVASGAIERDPAQVGLLRRFDALSAALAERRLARKGSALGWLFGRRQAAREPVEGLYVWGSVGRGKTMLMDLFFETLQVRRKRRAHFHAFMADVHGRIHAFRQDLKAGRVKGDDPIAPVAKAIAEESWVLCFDEFTVTDIADAMILGRLFKALFAEGVTVVATSNVEPRRLYEGGLNRALFEPFIGMIEARMAVVRLDARTDFRLEKLSGAETWHVPADAAGRAALDRAFKALTGRARGEPMTIAVKGRAVAVPQAAAGVARFGFADLCERPLGASDYLAIARDFHTVMIEGVPVMDQAKRNEAKRFITLVDALYDERVKVLATAEAPPPGLYTATHGREAFEFDRTVSRLVEMASQDYLGLPHGRPDSRASGETTGLVET
ncbi:cell division protein ZapE [Salinarimonas sp. NSM]|uniref:cell division protein ZapE n=1 Tax=Salinarimonas sp. NSM TaxID=3458003 RepID=UPI004036B969